MTRHAVICCTLILALTSASPLFASGIINKQGFSAEYFRTFSRNAEAESADAVAYNPAGVMMMENGLYGHFGFIHGKKVYANEIEDTNSITNRKSIVPNLFCVYKQDKWAAMGGVTILGGGGKAVFPNGSATTYNIGMEAMAAANQQLMAALTTPIPFGPGLTPAAASVFAFDNVNHRLDGESVIKGYTLGGACKINDKVSVAAGIRLVDGFEKAQATISIEASTPLTSPPFPAALAGRNGDINLDVDYEDTANGWGGIFGVNIAPSEDINIGFRYETSTRLNYKRRVKTDDTGTLRNNSVIRKDLPGLAGLGVAYNITKDLKTTFSYTYFFDNDAKDDLENFNDDGDSYNIGLAFEYNLTDSFRTSIGYMVCNTGQGGDDLVPENPSLDYDALGVGFACDVTPDLTFNFSFAKISYQSGVTRSDDIIIYKNIKGFAFGIQYKFL